MAETRVKAKPAVAVYIGRFQPYHNGHKAIVDYALDHYNYVIILLGSSFQPRSRKNPWYWNERVDMIHAAHPDAEHHIYVAPLRDQPDDAAWIKSVKATVNALAPPHSNITLIGHRSDQTSYYLDLFPEWGLEELESDGFRHGTEIRDDYFAREGAFESKVEHDVPLTTLSRMQILIHSDEFERLRAQK